MEWMMDLETDDLAGLVDGMVNDAMGNVLGMFQGSHLDDGVKAAMMSVAEQALMENDGGTVHVRTERMPDGKLYASFSVFTVKDGRRSDYRAHYWLHFDDDTLVAEKGW